MKSILIKLRRLLAEQVERAEQRAESENETTAEKYEPIAAALNEALSALDEAIAEFE